MSSEGDNEHVDVLVLAQDETECCTLNCLRRSSARELVDAVLLTPSAGFMFAEVELWNESGEPIVDGSQPLWHALAGGLVVVTAIPSYTLSVVVTPCAGANRSWHQDRRIVEKKLFEIFDQYEFLRQVELDESGLNAVVTYDTWHGASTAHSGLNLSMQHGLGGCLHVTPRSWRAPPSQQAETGCFDVDTEDNDTVEVEVVAISGALICKLTQWRRTCNTFDLAIAVSALAGVPSPEFDLMLGVSLLDDLAAQPLHDGGHDRIVRVTMVRRAEPKEHVVSISLELADPNTRGRLTEDDLLKVFSQFGPVRRLFIHPDARCKAEIAFWRELPANRAVSALHGKELRGLGVLVVTRAMF